MELALVPALYFYTDTGRYVRSLLYGFLNWLFSACEEDILSRKRVFVFNKGRDLSVRLSGSA